MGSSIFTSIFEATLQLQAEGASRGQKRADSQPENPMAWVQPLSPARLGGGSHFEEVTKRYLLTEDIAQAVHKLDTLVYGELAQRSSSVVQNQVEVQFELEELADLACQRKEGPGGEAEHLAAQLIYDTTLVMLLQKGVPDSDHLRSVMQQGAVETASLVFLPLCNARTSQTRALAQVAALQEALDEADKEMVRMRQEAEIMSIHAASTRAMMTLGRQPISARNDMRKDEEANLSLALTACEESADENLHLLGEVMRASWNSGAERAALESQIDMLKGHAENAEQLKRELATARNQIVQDEGRLIGLNTQLVAMQQTVVGEEVLRRDLIAQNELVASLKAQLEPLEQMQEQFVALQLEFTKLKGRTSKMDLALDVVNGVHARCLTASCCEMPLLEALDKVAGLLAGEEDKEGASKEEDASMYKNLLELVKAGRCVCEGLTRTRNMSVKTGASNIELERQLAAVAEELKQLQSNEVALKLKATEAQLAEKNLLCRVRELEKTVACTKRALEDTEKLLQETQRERDELMETYKSADRLLLASRELCARRAAQLEECVIQLTTLHQQCDPVKEELKAAYVNLTVELASLRDASAVNEELTSKLRKVTEELGWLQTAHNEATENLLALQSEVSIKSELLDKADADNKALQEEAARAVEVARITEAGNQQLRERVENEQLDLLKRESEVELLKVSVAQALNEQRLALETAESADEEASQVRRELLALRSSTWDERGAVSLEPTPRDADMHSVESIQAGSLTHRSPRYSYKKGLF